MTPKEITKLTMEAMRREREREFISALLAEPEKEAVAGREYYIDEN
jgi:hypothetical protein